MTRKRQYMQHAQALPTEYLQACADNPSAWMRPVHVAIIRIVLRQRNA